MDHNQITKCIKRTTKKVFYQKSYICYNQWLENSMEHDFTVGNDIPSPISMPWSVETF